MKSILSFIFLLAYVTNLPTGSQMMGVSESAQISVSLQSIDPKDINYELLNHLILVETNKLRIQHQLQALQSDPHLQSAAGDHAEYLSTQKSLAHINSKNHKMKTPGMRVDRTGANFQSVGENLARMSIYKLGKNGQFFVDENGMLLDQNGSRLQTLTYQELAEKVTLGWYHSKGHRENLLGDYTHLGLAEREMKTGREILVELVFVQNFGKY